MSKRLALGTVQLGLPYGIANQSGQVDLDEAKNILAYACDKGIITLDTAIAYGESESVLGKIGVDHWQVISKLPTLPSGDFVVNDWVNESVKDSLKRLGISKLRGLLLHSSQQLLEPQGNELYKSMIALKEQGKIEKMGVSIYSPDELDVLWPLYQFDIVQAPFNILDRRLDTSGWLTRLHMAGVEVHTRSAFLQGLLLMKASERPDKFRRWYSLWGQWHQWLENNNLSPVQACLAFVMSKKEIDRAVFGVDSLKQLKEILANDYDFSLEMPNTLMSDDLDLINPSRWSLL